MKSVRGAVAIAAVAAGLAGGALVAGVARGDDASSTAAILDSIERGSVERSGAPAKDVADMVKRARDAMERATRLRSAGDEPHARLVDGLAREDAEAARDLAKAIEAEQAADDARRAALDAGTRGERERALLEEGIARNGRLRAEIDEVGKPRGDAKTSRAATAEATSTRARPKAAAAAKDGGAP